MGLTKEQEKVRDTRNKNMLVSAAAGSGKTFVLVQRIISEILDEQNPIDVDRILVVTFTNAAAAEMKDRIRQAIDKAVSAKGADKRIKAQATLIHSAHIRTIDSFCSWIVKNYFYEIDQEPSFRIGTTGELKMLSDQVFDDLLSKYLESDDKEFRLLADAYISGRRTDTLKKMVFDLHAKAASYPWPHEWYQDALRIYDINSEDELEESEFIQCIIRTTDLVLSELLKRLSPLMMLYNGDYSTKDGTIISEEYSYIQAIINAKTYKEKVGLYAGFSPARWDAKKSPLNPDDIERIKEIRELYKGVIKDYGNDFFAMNTDELFDCISFVKKQATALIRFTQDYTDTLLKMKEKKNIYDFNDIEHMALEILRNKDSKEHEIRPVAIELANHFKEVMVDEYQDSNELQEQILTTITSGNNYFTVGDVKQSIYAFRQASPKLFIDKLYSYPMDDENADSVRIDLDYNFRSRGEVLNFCNQIFAPLMQADMGGVIYDERAALKVGDNTFKGEGKNYESEIIVASQDSEAMRELAIEDADSLEALVVAKRIKELKRDNFQVSFKNGDERDLRSMKYSDIVILMSAVKGHAEKFISVLKEKGIPAYVAEETGFFEREEIETVLSMLTCIDNPFNDIPLAAVLHSPMFGFSSNRLAQIRAKKPDGFLYNCLIEYQENKPSDDIAKFLDTLNRFRDIAIDTPIHEVIEMLLEETGYGLYVRALPLGKMAYANLEKLVDEAVSFEGTSFKGLSRFVEYIEGLRTYEEDLGLAKTVGENDDAVKIMTIHKSKGLEFPVVFVCGCGRGMANEGGKFCYDDSLGLALNYQNPTTRISCTTPFYSIVKTKLNESAKGEFFRKYYVALTRPVDKLIITATMKPTKDKSVADIINGFTASSNVVDYLTKEKAQSAIELMIRGLNATGVSYNKSVVECGQLFVDEVKNAVLREDAKNAIQRLVDEAQLSSDNEIVNTLAFKYDAIEDSKYKSKYSVSEIKHTAMESAYEQNVDAAPAFIHNEEESYIPNFMRAEINESANDEADSKIPAGALYGTAMHRFMECFDFARSDFRESFDEQLQYMKDVHMLSDDEQTRINKYKLKKFLSDDIAKRISGAAEKGLLFKEKPFVFGSNGRDLFDDLDASDELILVQGIIDVFFQEDDGIVLMDYKTDRVAEENELVLRYEKQLQLYKSAIEKAYNTPVKEMLLYSFALEKGVTICTTN
ncbi:helicase-exonuclease AddAB subunit AddA [Pseudobutyrivibrio xylanivorans]|uniref:DNA 3'-5' helicase n=1 Tax=Pseudobutyrivibrio xylanivorans DSM 14809 TaxID=1123012 RepID=A0A1M6HS18_PSEXY|nr:helicase-exonuclease AddAB subunit AddA [Pseudobutyrivibrio xylanivorans]SHJ25010.1 DNA helicase/exodeoxyribonuclease V, subunit A [Pseudobutyrivibrio xylanivorans DSM 14809]